jgi:hypothetical protein
MRPIGTLRVAAADHLFGTAAISSDDLGGVDTVGVFIIPGRIEFAHLLDRTYCRATPRVN